MATRAGMDVGQVLKRLGAIDKKLRRQALRKAGNAGTKVMLGPMKAAVPTRTKWLRKSLGRKVKLYGRGTRVWFGVGPRTNVKVLLKTQRLKRGRSKLVTLAKKTTVTTKEIRRSPERKGQRLHWPSKIAHLAGPGRKARWLKETINRTKVAVRAALIAELRNAVEHA